MIFKISQKEFDKMARPLIDDVAQNVLDEVKAQLVHIDPNYGWIADSFEYDGYNIVGSEEWAAASLNHGMEFKWPGKIPNIDNIMKWIKNTKDPYKFGSENTTNPSQALRRETFAIVNYIKAKGLQDDKGEYGSKHHWYFDSAILFVPQVSFDV